MRSLSLFLFFNLVVFAPLMAQHRINEPNKNFSIDCLSLQKVVAEKTLEEKWVRYDVNLIRQIFNKVPAQGATLNRLKRLIPDLLKDSNALHQKLYLGENLELIRYTSYGGYGSVQIEILHYDGLVLKINQYIMNYPEVIRDRLMPFIELPLTCVNGEAENQTLYPEHIALYRKTHKVFFPEDLDTAVNEKEKEAIFFFTDYSSVRQYMLGAMHVTASYLDEASLNIRYLVTENRTGLLEKLLYSSLPEGRVFAASALYYMQTQGKYIPTEMATKKMEEIQKKGTVFTIGTASCWTGQMRYEYYDVMKYFQDLTGI